jgi:hypothetical protein
MTCFTGSARARAARPRPRHSHHPPVCAPLTPSLARPCLQDLGKVEGRIRELLEHGWGSHDLAREFRRMGVPDSQWRVSEVNARCAGAHMIIVLLP